MSQDTTRRDLMTAGVVAVAATAAGPAAAQRPPARVAAGTRPTAAPLPGRANPNGRFAGKTLIVTGGTSGFGRAVAEEVAKEGGFVAFNGRREALGRQVETGIRGLGGQAEFTPVNVLDRPGLKRWIDTVAQRRGGIDLLHANAGIAQRPSPTAELDEAHWDELWRTNVSGMFYAIKDTIPHILRRGGGSIVMTGSAFGYRAAPQLAAYNANKYAVHGMMRSIALELGPQNVRVNAVAPGAVPTTDFGRNNGAPTPEGVAMGNSNHGIGRMGQTMEIAKAVVWLMSDEASFVAGEVLAVDGAFRVG